MKLDPPKNEQLQAWLDRAANGNLDEEQYRLLLEELPEDGEERQFWLDQLRISQALKASVQKGEEGELKSILNQIPSRQANPFGSSWVKSAAVVLVSFGILGLGLMMVPSSDQMENSREPVSVVTSMEEDESMDDFAIDEPAPFTLQSAAPQKAKGTKAESGYLKEGRPVVVNGTLSADAEIEVLEEVAEMDAVDVISDAVVVAQTEKYFESSKMGAPSKNNSPARAPIQGKRDQRADELYAQRTVVASSGKVSEKKMTSLAESTEKFAESSTLGLSGKAGQVAPKLARQEMAKSRYSKRESDSFTIQTPSAVAEVRGTSAPLSSKIVTDGSGTLSHGEAKVVGGMVDELPKIVDAKKAPDSPKGEKYVTFDDNRFTHTSNDAKSTFSIDVDTASYANVRRMLRDGQLPNPDAVRIEEMINTFRYDYAPPTNGQPFSVNMDQTPAPWNLNHRIVRVGLKGRVDLERPPVNLVFLLDVSGSMNSSDKLPLLKRSFSMLLNSLGEKDSVAIVAYAGHTGVVLDPTPATNRQKILQAMDKLRASGGTNGAGGIQLAYDLAKQSMIKDGVNRVVLATDGDFNVGISNRNQLITFIEEKRRTGVELSVLGFGRGNIRDDVMESLANKGNGNYSYIDSVREARKALVEELNSNLVTIAKDVKIQVEFNPETVQSFRLIGYENRKLAHRDFADDTKDAGEIGMGHSVTALYEVVPVSNLEDDAKVLTLNLRHKKPGGSVSQLQTSEFFWSAEPQAPATDLKWALAVATWGQMLRNSEHLGKLTPQDLLKLAREGRGEDPHGYRAEMIQLIESWLDLGGTNPTQNLPRWNYRR